MTNAHAVTNSDLGGDGNSKWSPGRGAGARSAGPSRTGFLLRVLAALSVAAVVSACGGVDADQARICETLLPALETDNVHLEVVGHEVDSAAKNAVIVRYRVRGAEGRPEEHWISCRFAGSGFDVGKRELTGVVTDRHGPLSEVRLFMLRRFWLGRFTAQAGVGQREAGAAGAPSLPFFYFLQQVVNALTVSCVYALLAMAYTLVYAIIGRINMAFGEFAMVGAYVALVAVHLATAAGTALPLVLMVALILSVAVTSLHGGVTERLIFRPLRGSGSQAVLIATVGLAIFLQEYVRLTQGARDRWLQPILSDVYRIAGSESFSVTITTFQVLIVVVAGTLFAVHRWLIEGSAFGRAWHACAQDPGMAALCGVNATRTILLTFVLGAGYAGMAGTIIALHYGGVGFYMGTILGFKALTAAIVGGIGSVTGAALGGLLIGFLETFWSGYLTAAYRDVAVFGLLAAVLVFRPQGLIGGPWQRGD